MRMDCKVYVGNLGNNAAKHELESAFSKYGPLVNVWVARNPPGFAFVEFEDPRDAEDAVRALDGTRLCGVRVRVEMSTGRSRRDRYRSPPRRGRRSRTISPKLLLVPPPPSTPPTVATTPPPPTPPQPPPPPQVLPPPPPPPPLLASASACLYSGLPVLGCRGRWGASLWASLPLITSYLTGNAT
ncbi:RNA-binding protein 1-like isoform X1 [Penaeus monodon]|uniref:RNA-binding protein 1-like isoform X1 n=1 Tax=Penaeus monodon TaxID=6687 RepID=UPI0018A76C34|nr:RNA-binding protein 1-like isoform X1 [Penaeus monodon]XP_037772545.1 RNA-binding protein 1-like isoform X1 [Penaeus monodon]XP_037772547.1 RNA-binding protein 1-like isoform X1 [Penaeus monodon]